MARLRSSLNALSGYGVLALLFTWPLPLRLSTHLTGPPSGDTGVYVWNQWIFRHELAALSDPLFTSRIFSVDPQVADLSLHNYTIFANLLALPFGAQDAVTAFNVTYLALMVVSAYAMFLLARDLTGGTAESWLAGALFAFSPALMARGMEHFSLVAAAPLPVFVLLVRRAQRTGSVAYGIGAGACVAWAATCDPYYGIYCVLLALWHAGSLVVSVRLAPKSTARARLRLVLNGLIGLLAAVMVAIALTGGTTLHVWGRAIGVRTLYTPAMLLAILAGWRAALAVRVRVRPGGLDQLRVLARLGAYGVAACAILLSPVLLPLARRVADGRYVSAPVYWRSSMPGVDLLNFVMPNPNHRLLGALGRNWMEGQAGGAVENVASVTFVALVVMLVAVRYARFRPSAYWAGGTLVAGSMAVGPFLSVGGFNTCVPTPWALMRYLPVVGSARAPSRLSVLVILGVAALFAMALRHLGLAWPAWRRSILTAVFCGLAFELAPTPRTLYSADIPPIYHRIAADPRDVRVLELPFGVRDGLRSAGDFSPASQFYQVHHRKRLIGGYLSRVSSRRFAAACDGPIRGPLILLSERRPLGPDQAASLLSQGRGFVDRWSVAYVVVDRARATPDLIDFAKRAFLLEKLGESGDRELYGTPLAFPRDRAARAR
jgi:hypothetical protein